MAEPAADVPLDDDVPTIDPAAVDRAYRLHRARREARIARRRTNRRARLRFWVVLLALVAAILLLALAVLRRVQDLFGI